LRRVIRRPPPPPPPPPSLHETLAAHYLRGSGLEIGALHNPLPVPPEVRVRYVDRMSVADLRMQYPELCGAALVEPDVLDDGERLATVPDASQDFLIANHFLEHTQDPIGCLQRFFQVLKPGAVAYITLPDKRYTFDRERAVTALEHLRQDHEHGPEPSRRAHFEDFVRHVHPPQSEDGVRRAAEELMARDYSIHFHVWTQHEMLQLLLALQPELHFDFELVRKNGIEVIFILRKHETNSPTA
jgi:hypothetical protein